MDYSRHLLEFDPSKFRNRVDVVGCGAVGSFVAFQLAKLGVRNLHLWDGDKVEPHNVPNQFFTERHVGQNKASALAAHIEEQTGITPTAHPQFVTEQECFGEVVFLCIDSMEARRQIFETSLRFSLSTKLMVETRMGKGEFRVYGLRPSDALLGERWLGTLHSDEETQENMCSARVTIIQTVMANAAFAIARFVEWYRKEYENDSVPQAFERVCIMNPLTSIEN